MGDNLSIKQLEKSAKSRKFIKFLCLFLSEFFGTFMLLFIGCMSHGEFQFSLTYVMCVQIWGPTSGGHVNPAVTLGALVFGVIHWAYAITYIIAQILGALVGYIVLNGLCTVECLTLLSTNCPEWKVLLIEFFATGTLLLVFCSIWDERNKPYQESVPLRIGFTTAVGIFVSAAFSGGSLNPARSFAPALYHDQWEDHWVYWLGPILGAISAAFFYRFLFERKASDKRDTDELPPPVV